MSMYDKTIPLIFDRQQYALFNGLSTCCSTWSQSFFLKLVLCAITQNLVDSDPLLILHTCSSSSKVCFIKKTKTIGYYTHGDSCHCIHKYISIQIRLLLCDCIYIYFFLPFSFHRHPLLLSFDGEEPNTKGISVESMRMWYVYVQQHIAYCPLIHNRNGPKKCCFISGIPFFRIPVGGHF